MVQTAGAWDPAAGVGVGFRFESTSPFSGVHDTKLNNLLNDAQAATSMSQRCALYDQAASYIAQNYYGPFYFAYAPANVAVKNLVGPGLTEPLPTVVVQSAILWEDVIWASIPRTPATARPIRGPRWPAWPCRPSGCGSAR